MAHLCGGFVWAGPVRIAGGPFDELQSPIPSNEPPPPGPSLVSQPRLLMLSRCNNTEEYGRFQPRATSSTLTALCCGVSSFLAIQKSKLGPSPPYWMVRRP